MEEKDSYVIYVPEQAGWYWLAFVLHNKMVDKCRIVILDEIVKQGVESLEFLPKKLHSFNTQVGKFYRTNNLTLGLAALDVKNNCSVVHDVISGAERVISASEEKIMYPVGT